MSKKHRKKLNYRFFISLSFILIILCVIIFISSIRSIEAYTLENETNITKGYTSSDTNESSVLAASPAFNNTNSNNDWRLVLVNRDNPLPNNYKISLLDIDSYRQFDSRAIDDLKALIQAAKDAGHSNLWVQSSYRSVERQAELYNEQLLYYKNLGYSDSQAETLAQNLVNKPGHSEHNSGLAVDFNYVGYSFENLSVFDWLCKNAADYGFILRYPEDKTDITNVNYEPWHWRYVGVEYAKAMKEKGFCLEEYIDYLNNMEE